MVESKTFTTKLLRTVNYALLSILALSCLYPLWYTLCLSLSDKTAANSGMVTLWPINFTTISYREIMKESKFFHSFFISVERTVLGTAFTTLVLVLFAYPLSKTRREFSGVNIFKWSAIFCMVFSGGTIPWYITMVNYGMIDSMIGLILCGGLPVFNLILIINFFRSLPDSLEEAAVVDGAGPWRILFSIVVPCSVPVLATIILFTGVGYWNEFFQGMVLSSSDSSYPLQAYIQQMVVTTQIDHMSPDQLKLYSQMSNKSLNAAKVFIAMVPMMCVYPFLQRYFVTGVLLGAVKV